MKDNRKTNAATENAAVQNQHAAEHFRKSRQKQRKLPTFYIAYIVGVAIALFCIGGALIFENSYLAEYEQSQPKYVAEEVFAEHFSTKPSPNELAEMASAALSDFVSAQDVAKFISESIEWKDVTYSETISGDDDIYIYNVYLGSKKFATFSLCKGDNKTKNHGLPIYELCEKQLTFKLPANSYDLLIPEGCILSANGTRVSDSFLSGEYVESDAYKISNGKVGLRYAVYSVDGFLSTPTFSVTDATGKPLELFYDTELECYKVRTNSLTLRIPESYTAYIGGGAVSEQYRTDDTVTPSAYDQFLDTSAKKIGYVTYTVDGFFEIPLFSVRDEDQKSAFTRYMEQEQLYEALPVYDSTLKQQNEEWLIEAFRKYMLVMQNIEGTSKADIKSYFDTKSAIWKHISSIDPGWQFEAHSYKFSNESATEFVKTGDDSYFCRIKLTYEGKRNSSTYTESIDLIVFLKKSTNSYLIYDIVNVGAIEGIGAPTK